MYTRALAATWYIKVCDFGDDTRLRAREALRPGDAGHPTKAGTPYYVAPEVMDGNYTYKCDMWSSGGRGQLMEGEIRGGDSIYR